MREATAISDLPRVPAIYALYGGEGRRYVAYVGLGGNLRQRVEQRLIRRDSSVVAGIHAVGLRGDQVRRVDWWEDAGFGDDVRLQAAELVAFDVLEPPLRSRGGIGEAARALSKNDNFHTQMDRLFRGQPSGRLTLPALGQLANQVADLERRLASIEQQLRNHRP